MKNNLKLEIVSAQESLYSGDIKFVVVPGEEGELGIYPNHTPLITRIKPGELKFKNLENENEVIVVAGGILEVQPNLVTVLADSAIRAADIDEERSKEAKQKAESIIKNNKQDIDLAKAHAELAFAIAELTAIEKFRGKR
jgi:F-type H+-transporting ATPase subunit epsilon